MNNDISKKGELNAAVEAIQENLTDVIHIVQLIEISLSENMDDQHIIRSIQIVSKMLYAIREKDLKTLKNFFYKKC